MAKLPYRDRCSEVKAIMLAHIASISDALRTRSRGSGRLLVLLDHGSYRDVSALHSDEPQPTHSPVGDVVFMHELHSLTLTWWVSVM